MQVLRQRVAAGITREMGTRRIRMAYICGWASAGALPHEHSHSGVGCRHVSDSAVSAVFCGADVVRWYWCRITWMKIAKWSMDVEPLKKPGMSSRENVRAIVVITR